MKKTTDDYRNWKIANDADRLAASSIAVWIENSIEFLPRFSVEHVIDGTAQMPRCAGVYLFTNDKEEILYVGKAKNLSARVNGSHHRIQKAIAEGATAVLAAPIDYKYVWATEQKLIHHFAPLLNARLTKWWEGTPVLQLESYGLAGVPSGYRFLLERVLHGPAMRPLSLYEKLINPHAIDEWDCPQEWKVTRPRKFAKVNLKKCFAIRLYSDGKIEQVSEKEFQKTLAKS